MTRLTTLHLTWAGLDAAIDMLAAQCSRRDRSGVYGIGLTGQLMASALSHRQGLELLLTPAPSMIEVHGVATQVPPSCWAWPDAEVWAWVDATPGQRVLSVMKATHGTLVLMPWQHAISSRRPFVPGFDD